MIEDTTKGNKPYNFEFTTDLSSDSGLSNNFQPELDTNPFTYEKEKFLKSNRVSNIIRLNHFLINPEQPLREPSLVSKNRRPFLKI